MEMNQRPLSRKLSQPPRFCSFHLYYHKNYTKFFQGVSTWPSIGIPPPSRSNQLNYFHVYRFQLFPFLTRIPCRYVCSPYRRLHSILSEATVTELNLFQFHPIGLGDVFTALFADLIFAYLSATLRSQKVLRFFQSALLRNLQAESLTLFLAILNERHRGR